VDHGDGLASIDSGNGPRREHADQRVLGSVVGKQSKSGDRSRCRLPRSARAGMARTLMTRGAGRAIIG
jgi:hypothetical protein